jgi:hypothetical protein
VTRQQGPALLRIVFEPWRAPVRVAALTVALQYLVAGICWMFYAFATLPTQAASDEAQIAELGRHLAPLVAGGVLTILIIPALLASVHARINWRLSMFRLLPILVVTTVVLWAGVCWLMWPDRPLHETRQFEDRSFSWRFILVAATTTRQMLMGFLTPVWIIGVLFASYLGAAPLRPRD